MKTKLNRMFAVLLVVLLSFSSLTIYSVKARFPPPTLKIHITSPSNKTYNQNSILINFSYQKQPSDTNQYNIDYAIEGEKANYSGIFLYMQQPTSNQLNFSKKITGIPDGTYLLTISAKYLAVLYWDYADKQTVTFTIDTKTATPTPSIPPSPPKDGPATSPSLILPLTGVITIIIVGSIILAEKLSKKRRGELNEIYTR